MAVLILGLGLAMAIVKTVAEPPPPTTPEEIAEMSIEERVEVSREPTWYSFSMPTIGFVGIILGGKIRHRGRADGEAGE